MSNQKKSDFESRIALLSRYSKAISHPARIAILEILASRSSCICGEIVEVLPLAQSTVSQHLKELKKAGLIQGRIDGLKSCYCLNPKFIKEFKSLFTSHINKLEQNLTTARKC